MPSSNIYKCWLWRGIPDLTLCFQLVLHRPKVWGEWICPATSRPWPLVRSLEEAWRDPQATGQDWVWSSPCSPNDSWICWVDEGCFFRIFPWVSLPELGNLLRYVFFKLIYKPRFAYYNRYTHTHIYILYIQTHFNSFFIELKLELRVHNLYHIIYVSHLSALFRYSDIPQLSSDNFCDHRHFQGLEPNLLPSTLLSLTLGSDFDQRLDGVKLPSTLQILTFGGLTKWWRWWFSLFLPRGNPSALGASIGNMYQDLRYFWGISI